MEAALSRIADYVSDCLEDRFFAEPMRMDAVAMNLTVLGEGGKRLSEAIKTQLDAPWPAIIALRHRLAHAYPGVDMQIVWTIAVRHAPDLRRAIQRALERR